MKKIFALALTALTLAACGTTSKVAKPSVGKNIEGQKVVSYEREITGYTTAKGLSKDGKKLEDVVYKWYAGVGEMDNEQVAIELAQREAYNTISRVMNQIVMDEAHKGGVANNTKVITALNLCWDQFSQSMLKGCEPFGNALIEYNPSTRVYKATAKIAIRADKFLNLLETASNFTPAEITEDKEALAEFIEINKSIMSRARGE